MHPSVRSSVYPSVHPSVRPSVRSFVSSLGCRYYLQKHHSDPYHWQELEQLSLFVLWIAKFIHGYVKVFLPSVRPNGSQWIQAHGLQAQVTITHIQARTTPNKSLLIYFSVRIDGRIYKIHPDVYKFRWYILGGINSTGDVKVIIKRRLRRGQNIMYLVIIF